MKREKLCELAGTTEPTLSTHIQILIASLFDNPHAYLNAPQGTKQKVLNFIREWKLSEKNEE